MGRIGGAIAGIVASGGLIAGAYLADNVEMSNSRAEAALCIEAYEGEQRTECIDAAREHNQSDIPEILAVIGLIGVVGSGYLGYKALKAEVGTTGLIEDYL